MQRQTGITLIGFIFVLVIAAFFVYTAVKLVPPYIDYLNVVKAMDTVATESRSAGMSTAQLRGALQRQQISQYFADEDIAAENVHVVSTPNGGATLRLRYDKRVPWIYNIEFLLHFDKSVVLRGAAQG